MARRPCATRSPRRSRPSLTSCVDRSPGTKALRCHSTLNCGLTLAWLCTSVNLTARGSVAATRTPTACYVSTSRRAQISPDTPPTISLLSLPTSTAALARPSDGRPPPRRSTSIYYRFNQPALRRPLESAHDTPSRLLVPSTWATVQTGVAALGSVDVTTLPLASTATHTDADGHDTPASLLVPSTWATVQTGVAAL